MKKIFYTLFLLGTIVAVKNPLTVFAVDNDNITVNAAIAPTISIAINNHTVDFGTVPAVDNNVDLTAATTLTVSSNANYKILAQASGDLAGPSFTIPIANLKVKESTSGVWVDMSKTAQVVLKDSLPPTASTNYNLDFRLATQASFNSDNYTTTVNVAISQI